MMRGPTDDKFTLSVQILVTRSGPDYRHVYVVNLVQLFIMFCMNELACLHVSAEDKCILVLAIFMLVA